MSRADYRLGTAVAVMLLLLLGPPSGLSAESNVPRIVQHPLLYHLLSEPDWRERYPLCGLYISIRSGAPKTDVMSLVG